MECVCIHPQIPFLKFPIYNVCMVYALHMYIRIYLYTQI